MTCTHIKLPGGTRAIVCGRSSKPPRCLWCEEGPGTLLCDWKLGAGRTCDNPICGAHAKEVAPDKHLCPDHQSAYAQWRAQREHRKEGAT